MGRPGVASWVLVGVLILHAHALLDDNTHRHTQAYGHQDAAILHRQRRVKENVEAFEKMALGAREATLNTNEVASDRRSSILNPQLFLEEGENSPRENSEEDKKITKMSRLKSRLLDINDIDISTKSNFRKLKDANKEDNEDEYRTGHTTSAPASVDQLRSWVESDTDRKQTYSHAKGQYAVLDGVTEFIPDVDDYSQAHSRAAVPGGITTTPFEVRDDIFKPRASGTLADATGQGTMTRTSASEHGTTNSETDTAELVGSPVATTPASESLPTTGEDHTSSPFSVRAAKPILPNTEEPGYSRYGIITWATIQEATTGTTERQGAATRPTSRPHAAFPQLLGEDLHMFDSLLKLAESAATSSSVSPATSTQRTATTTAAASPTSHPTVSKGDVEVLNMLPTGVDQAATARPTSGHKPPTTALATEPSHLTYGVTQVVMEGSLPSHDPPPPRQGSSSSTHPLFLTTTIPSTVVPGTTTTSDRPPAAYFWPRPERFPNTRTTTRQPVSRTPTTPSETTIQQDITRTNDISITFTPLFSSNAPWIVPADDLDVKPPTGPTITPGPAPGNTLQDVGTPATQPVTTPTRTEDATATTTTRLTTVVSSVPSGDTPNVPWEDPSNPLYIRTTTRRPFTPSSATPARRKPVPRPLTTPASINTPFTHMTQATHYTNKWNLVSPDKRPTYPLPIGPAATEPSTIQEQVSSESMAEGSASPSLSGSYVQPHTIAASPISKTQSPDPVNAPALPTSAATRRPFPGHLKATTSMKGSGSSLTQYDHSPSPHDATTRPAQLVVNNLTTPSTMEHLVTSSADASTRYDPLYFMPTTRRPFVRPSVTAQDKRRRPPRPPGLDDYLASVINLLLDTPPALDRRPPAVEITAGALASTTFTTPASFSTKAIPTPAGHKTRTTPPGENSTATHYSHDQREPSLNNWTPDQEHNTSNRISDVAPTAVASQVSSITEGNADLSGLIPPVTTPAPPATTPAPPQATQWNLIHSWSPEVWYDGPLKPPASPAADPHVTTSNISHSRESIANSENNPAASSPSVAQTPTSSAKPQEHERVSGVAAPPWHPDFKASGTNTTRGPLLEGPVPSQRHPSGTSPPALSSGPWLLTSYSGFSPYVPYMSTFQSAGTSPPSGDPPATSDLGSSAGASPPSPVDSQVQELQSLLMTAAQDFLPRNTSDVAILNYLINIVRVKPTQPNQPTNVNPQEVVAFQPRPHTTPSITTITHTVTWLPDDHDFFSMKPQHTHLKTQPSVFDTPVAVTLTKDVEEAEVMVHKTPATVHTTPWLTSPTSPGSSRPQGAAGAGLHPTIITYLPGDPLSQASTTLDTRVSSGGVGNHESMGSMPGPENLSQRPFGSHNSEFHGTKSPSHINRITTSARPSYPDSDLGVYSVYGSVNTRPSASTHLPKTPDMHVTSTPDAYLSHQILANTQPDATAPSPVTGENIEGVDVRPTNTWVTAHPTPSGYCADLLLLSLSAAGTTTYGSTPEHTRVDPGLEHHQSLPQGTALDHLDTPETAGANPTVSSSGTPPQDVDSMMKTQESEVHIPFPPYGTPVLTWPQEGPSSPTSYSSSYVPEIQSDLYVSILPSRTTTYKPPSDVHATYSRIIPQEVSVSVHPPDTPRLDVQTAAAALGYPHHYVLTTPSVSNIRRRRPSATQTAGTTSVANKPLWSTWDGQPEGNPGREELQEAGNVGFTLTHYPAGVPWTTEGLSVSLITSSPVAARPVTSHTAPSSLGLYHSDSDPSLREDGSEDDTVAAVSPAGPITTPPVDGLNHNTLNPSSQEPVLSLASTTAIPAHLPEGWSKQQLQEYLATTANTSVTPSSTSAPYDPYLEWSSGTLDHTSTTPTPTTSIETPEIAMDTVESSINSLVSEMNFLDSLSSSHPTFNQSLMSRNNQLRVLLQQLMRATQGDLSLGHVLAFLSAQNNTRDFEEEDDGLQSSVTQPSVSLPYQWPTSAALSWRQTEPTSFFSTRRPTERPGLLAWPVWTDEGGGAIVRAPEPVYVSHDASDMTSATQLQADAFRQTNYFPARHPAAPTEASVVTATETATVTVTTTALVTSEDLFASQPTRVPILQQSQHLTSDDFPTGLSGGYRITPAWTTGYYHPGVGEAGVNSQRPELYTSGVPNTRLTSVGPLARPDLLQNFTAPHEDTRAGSPDFEQMLHSPSSAEDADDLGGSQEEAPVGLRADESYLASSTSSNAQDPRPNTVDLTTFSVFTIQPASVSEPKQTAVTTTPTYSAYQSKDEGQYGSLYHPQDEGGHEAATEGHVRWSATPLGPATSTDPAYPPALHGGGASTATENLSNLATQVLQLQKLVFMMMNSTTSDAETSRVPGLTTHNFSTKVKYGAATGYPTLSPGATSYQQASRQGQRPVTGRSTLQLYSTPVVGRPSSFISDAPSSSTEPPDQVSLENTTSTSASMLAAATESDWNAGTTSMSSGLMHVNQPPTVPGLGMQGIVTPGGGDMALVSYIVDQMHKVTEGLGMRDRTATALGSGSARPEEVSAAALRLLAEALDILRQRYGWSGEEEVDPLQDVEKMQDLLTPFMEPDPQPLVPSGSSTLQRNNSVETVSVVDGETDIQNPVTSMKNLLSIASLSLSATEATPLVPTTPSLASATGTQLTPTPLLNPNTTAEPPQVPVEQTTEHPFPTPVVTVPLPSSGGPSWPPHLPSFMNRPPSAVPTPTTLAPSRRPGPINIYDVLWPYLKPGGAVSAPGGSMRPSNIRPPLVGSDSSEDLVLTPTKVPAGSTRPSYPVYPPSAVHGGRVPGNNSPLYPGGAYPWNNTPGRPAWSTARPVVPTEPPLSDPALTSYPPRGNIQATRSPAPPTAHPGTLSLPTGEDSSEPPTGNTYPQHKGSHRPGLRYPSHQPGRWGPGYPATPTGVIPGNFEDSGPSSGADKPGERRPATSAAPVRSPGPHIPGLAGATQPNTGVYRCGMVGSARVSNFLNPSYPLPDHGGGRCVFRLLVPDPTVCQVRVDFVDSAMLLPVEGRCRDQRLHVTGAVRSPPVSAFCGRNADQHFYVELADAQAAGAMRWLDFVVTTSTSSRRLYRYGLWITQLRCSPSEPLLAPRGCLQYFLGSSGVIKSYNYEGQQYLNHQDYRICVRVAPRACAITFSAKDGEFSLQKAGPIDVSSVRGGVGSRSCVRDYLFLPNLLRTGGGLGAAPGAGQRLCGSKFSYIHGDAFNRPVTGLVTGRVYVLHFRTGEQPEEEGAYSSLTRGLGYQISYQQRSCVSTTDDGKSPFHWTFGSRRGDPFPADDHLEVSSAASSLPPFFLRPGHAPGTSPGPASGPVRGGPGPVELQVFPDGNTGGDLNPLLLYARRGLGPQGNGTDAVGQPAGAEFPSARDPAGAAEAVAPEDTNLLSAIGNIVSETLQEALPGFGNSLGALLGGTIAGRGADADQTGPHTSTTRQEGRRSHAAGVTSRTAQVKKYKGSSYGDSFIISLLPRSSGRPQAAGGERNQSSGGTVRVAAMHTPATRAKDSSVVTGAAEPSKYGTKFESTVNSINNSKEINGTISDLKRNSSLSDDVSNVHNSTNEHPGPETKEEMDNNTDTDGLTDAESTSENVTGNLNPVKSNLLLFDASDSYLDPSQDRGRLNARLSDPAAQALRGKPTAVKKFSKFSGEGSPAAVSPYLTSSSSQDEEGDDNEGGDEGETPPSSSSLHFDSSSSPTPIVLTSSPFGSSPSPSEPAAPPPSSLTSRIPSSPLTLSDPMTKKEALVRHVPDSKASDTFIISLVSELHKTASGEGGQGADIDRSTMSPELAAADEDVGRTVDLGDSDERGTREMRIRRNVAGEDPHEDREGRAGDLVTWYPDTFRYDHNWATTAPPLVGGHLAKPPRPAGVNKGQLIVKKALEKVVTRRQPSITVTSRPYNVLPAKAYEKLLILRDKLKKNKIRHEDTGVSIQDTKHASTSSSYAVESGGGSNSLVTWRPYPEEVFQDTDDDQSKLLVTWSSVQDS